MDSIIFDNWQSLLRIFILGVLAYLSLIVMLRISGKRTLSQMNAFDFIVTVALGSTLASIITSKDTALADGLMALGVLIGLQYIITSLSVRYKAVDKLVKGSPTLLYYKGEYQRDKMKRERVTEEEMMSLMRSEGMEQPDEVDAIVLETNGKYTVLTHQPGKEAPDEIELLEYVER